MVTATAVACAFASRIKARCPAWSAPIVGTSPSRPPERRMRSAATRNSAAVLTIASVADTSLAQDLLCRRALHADTDHIHGRFDLGELRQGRRDPDVAIAGVLAARERGPCFRDL